MGSSVDDLFDDLTALAERRSAEWLFGELRHGAWIYGAGHYGQRLAALMAAAGLECLGFIDRRGGEALPMVNGLPVYAPSDFPSSLAAGRCFVLGALNPAVEPGEILALARTLPFRAILWNGDLPEVLGPAANTVWLSSRSSILAERERLCALAERLADPVSREILATVLRFRCAAGFDTMPAYDAANQYLPPDLPGFIGPIGFVDGGAYVGDTLQALRRAGVEIRDWLAFEPDTANFRPLAQMAGQAGVRAALFPCCLSDHSHPVSFEAELGTGSRIAETGAMHTVTVPAVALDDVLHGCPVDFIKLDIEGAEAAALRGMRQTIDRWRPRLAISVYHRPEDLWTIPEQMIGMCPSARFHLRQHARNGFDTVFYAVP